MIRMNPAHDVVNPPGTTVVSIIDGVVSRSSEPPVKSEKEIYDKGYADGWLDAQASLKKWQEEYKR